MKTRLQREIHRWNGVIPSRALIEAGWTYRELRALCGLGELRRVRQGWLAVPGADTELVLAASTGGVITCVSQARRLGLWLTRDDPRLHLGINPQGQKPHAEGLHVHWRAPLVARDPRCLEDHLVNVLAAAAECLPSEDALALWESAVRKRLIELSELRRLSFTGRASELAHLTQPLADSGLESFVRWRLRRFKLQVRAQAWILGHYVDLLIGDRLIVQIDGGTHVGKQRTSDIAHDALLMVNGYHVIRVSYEQLVHRWHEVQDLILRAVAQGLASA